MTSSEERRYSELLRAKRPHVIRTEAENEKALREVEAMLSRGDVLPPAETELLQLLTVLIERFEQDHYAMSPATRPISNAQARKLGARFGVSPLLFVKV